MCQSCRFKFTGPGTHEPKCNCYDCLSNFDRMRFRQIQRELVDRGLTYLGQGAGRAVYVSRSGRFVYKVPLNAWGVDANLREHKIFRHKNFHHSYLSHDRIARCRLAPSGVLVMELIKIGSRREREYLPSWAGFIDSYQVGWNRAGEPVAYDFGSE